MTKRQEKDMGGRDRRIKRRRGKEDEAGEETDRRDSRKRQEK